MRKIISVILAAVFVSFATVALYLNFSGSLIEKGIETTVSRIVDGDTVELANGDLVRLIGIDAPEKNQPYYDEVVGQLKKLEGKIIRMEKDKTNKDRYGRYLRYIFLDDHFVNLELVQNGLVYAYIVSPDKRYEKELLEAEAVARASGMGIWNKSEYSDCIELETLHYNARGEDDKNLTDEFFVIRNSCDKLIAAENWGVRNTFNTFSMPDFSLNPGSEMKIISGSGRNSDNEIFISSKRPIWNNKGDTLYLKDAEGRIILSKSYKNE